MFDNSKCSAAQCRVAFLKKKKTDIVGAFFLCFFHTVLFYFYFYLFIFQIDWAQCDRCERWYHLVCVGLKKKDVGPKSTFNCSACQKEKVSRILVFKSG